jgi:hypothetical protein
MTATEDYRMETVSDNFRISFIPAMFTALVQSFQSHSTLGHSNCLKEKDDIGRPRSLENEKALFIPFRKLSPRSGGLHCSGITQV